MASGSQGIRALPWRARVKHNYVEYFLGYLDTKQAAEEAENNFREREGLPPKKRKRTDGHQEGSSTEKGSPAQDAR